MTLSNLNNIISDKKNTCNLGYQKIPQTTYWIKRNNFN